MRPERAFKTVTLKWWQAALMKVSLISFGIIIGIAWSDYLFNSINIFFILFLVPAIYLVYVWWKQ